jgi:zinc transport system substrate-binding protein
MKQILSLLLLLLLLLPACKAPKAPNQEEKQLILTSIYPYELLVKQLVGDAIEVRSLIPQNASVHSFNPQPSHLKDIHKADLILINGLGLENMFEQQLQNAGEKLIVAADLLKDLIALDSLNMVRENLMHAHSDNEDEHHHSFGDPHLWTSPQMMMKLSTKLKAELVSRFVDFAPLINHNYDELFRQLTEADSKIQSERNNLQNPALVTYHNSFHYFTRDYDIHYLGWVQSSPGKEPSARDLADLGNKIKEHKVKMIFKEPQENPKSAEVLAREYSLKLGTLDPIGASLNVHSIPELILENWNAMKQAF